MKLSFAETLLLVLIACVFVPVWIGGMVRGATKKKEGGDE